MNGNIKRIWRFSIFTDIALNILLPVFLGYLLYLINDKGIAGRLIKNHLPDGLWAYALLSSILIIWNRKIKIYWCIIILLFSILIEVLQYLEILSGTGDILDILTYLIFFGLALQVNKYFLKYKFQQHRS